jgi:hypothetical protein
LSLEDVRNKVRYELHGTNSTEFPIGAVGTSVTTLAVEILRMNNNVASSQKLCFNCGYEMPEIEDRLGYVIHTGNWNAASTLDFTQSL